MNTSLSRRVQWGIAIASCFIAISIMYWLRSVFTPLLIALALAYVLNPLVSWLERCKVRRSFSIIAVYFLLLIVSLATLSWGLPKMWDEAASWKTAFVGEAFIDKNKNGMYDEGEAWTDENSDGIRAEGLSEQIETMIDKENSVVSRVAKFAGVEDVSDLTVRIKKQIRENVEAIMQGVVWVQTQAASGVSGMFTIGGQAVSVLTGILLIPFYLYFFLLGFDKICNKSVEYIPKRHRTRIVDIFKKIDKSVAAFFRGQLLVCTLISIVTVVGFLLCGVRFAVIGGIAIGIASFIPFINVIFLIPIAIIAYLDTQSIGVLVGVFIAYGIGQAIDPLVKTFVIGKEVQLHPVTIVVSLFAFGSAFGVFGMILAIPLAATSKILIHEFLLPVFKDIAGS